ncbi:MAG: efflux transporter periplasmic adaptor subunit [Anaeromyxobacter sp. RBG_16_69_14]|nr:MAG: efflux transporter periplasmic adaptor subunit [Anaeromyxobacter sp. RBG_16_69_14]
MPRNRRGWIASSSLLVTVLATGAGLAAWKVASIREADAAATSKPEPAESVAVAVAKPRDHRETVTSIGTVLAMRSVTLRNEIAGTVSEVALSPGQIVEAGTVLVRLDVSVEKAELQAQQAQAALARTLLRRSQQAQKIRAVSAMEVDRAGAERDVAVAQIARTQAVIARKTIRAPFRARVGLADVHRGQYLETGTVLTTLQGIDDSAHVDFTVAQRVAAGLRKGDDVRVSVTGDDTPHTGTIIAVDARVDPATRNASVRARIEGGSDGPAPGASVRVEVQDGPSRSAVVVPVGAVRKGPAGDHVFVIARGEDGRTRARVRPVQSGPVLDDEVLILGGLSAGERVAAAGSFKLREAALVAVAEELAAAGEAR